MRNSATLTRITPNKDVLRACAALCAYAHIYAGGRVVRGYNVGVAAVADLVTGCGAVLVRGGFM